MKIENDTKVICLTPVRNGEWMIEKFIQCASIWADYIILLDQNSDDNTVSLSLKYDRVKVVKNNTEIFDEVAIRQSLLDEARKIQCNKRVIVFLDSDELISANSMTSCEWKTLISQPKGTFFTAKLINYFPTHDTYFSPSTDFFFAFIDAEDLSFYGDKIHGWRVPRKYGNKVINFYEIKILHFPYINYSRTKAKYYWYKCVELIHYPKIGSFGLNRKYDLAKLNTQELFQSKSVWLKNYSDAGIDVFSEIDNGSVNWYYLEMIKFFKLHGVKKFQYLNIWDINWLHYDLQIGPLIDKRTKISKIVRRLSQFTVKRTGKIVYFFESLMNKIV